MTDGPPDLRWWLTTDHWVVATVREVITSAFAVAVVGGILIGVSGVWPPLVAVESGSMEPQMQAGDLVFVVDADRHTPAAAHADTGIVTAEDGFTNEYERFGGPGDVVVFDPPDREGSPIIHRAMFWVEEGEDWYERADESAVSADHCGELANCPAPHAGFITKGDANGAYDQARRLSSPVRPEWVSGVGLLRFPGLGWVRLCLTQSDQCEPLPT